jgi:hypothetical protein
MAPAVVPGGHSVGGHGQAVDAALGTALVAHGLAAMRPVGLGQPVGSGSEPSSTPSNSGVER